MKGASRGLHLEGGLKGASSPSSLKETSRMLEKGLEEQRYLQGLEPSKVPSTHKSALKGREVIYLMFPAENFAK